MAPRTNTTLTEPHRWGLLALLALGAMHCGGKAEKRTTTPSKTPERIGDQDGSDRGHTASEPNPTEALSEAECRELLNHVVDLAFAEGQAQGQELTAADRERATEILQGELLGACVGRSRREFPYDCSMEAEGRQELEVCMGGQPSAEGGAPGGQTTD